MRISTGSIHLNMEWLRCFLFVCIIAACTSQPYKLQHCFHNRLTIVKDKITTIRCTGLDPSQNMYWTITESNGDTRFNAQCNFCPNGGRCPACKWDSGITVTRSGRFSDLQIVLKNVVHGWRVRCSKSDNATFDECPIRVKFSQGYSLPQCKDGTLELSEAQPQAAILCEGHQSWENMNWTITDDTGSPILIGYCSQNTYDSGYDCNSIDSDLHFERNASLGQLTINSYTRNKFVNKLLTCIRHDGDIWDSCKIRVVYGPTSANVTSQINLPSSLGTVTLTCTSDDVYPAANFSWSVPCVTLTLTTRISTCDVAKGTLANVPKVVCTAYNSEIPSLNTSAVYNIPAAYLKQNEDSSLAPVVGGVVAAVVVIGIIIVVVIIIVKRKSRSGNGCNGSGNDGLAMDPGPPDDSGGHYEVIPGTGACNINFIGYLTPIASNGEAAAPIGLNGSLRSPATQTSSFQLTGQKNSGDGIMVPQEDAPARPDPPSEPVSRLIDDYVSREQLPVACDVCTTTK